MFISRARCIISAAALLSFLSTIAILVNSFIYHYPGNNYFPPNTFFITWVLILMYGGFALQFGGESPMSKVMKEVMYFFLIMAVLALTTNAAQFTPFPTIDGHILALESWLHIDIKSLITWTHSKPILKTILDFTYDTLPYQMTYFPLIIIATRPIHYIREYYFLLLASAIMGFTFYYFFPTIAPASIFASPYFSASQLATGLKFMQLHHHIQPTTMDGGMIALPSFHVIWAWLCLYLLRGWPIAFAIMLPVNLILMLSCVFLGWHYVMDIGGAIVVILISHGLYHFCLQSCIRPKTLPILRFESRK